LKERASFNQEINYNCEYYDVCRDLGRKCAYEDRIKCGDRHSWMYIDLNELFKEKIDSNKNYLLDFSK
jgi:hypothetical protein